MDFKSNEYIETKKYIVDDEGNNNKSYFTYDALQLLSNDIENVFSQYVFDEVVLVPFKINFNGKTPFNTIMLINDYSSQLTFPSINISSFNQEKITFFTMINCYLYALFMSDNQYYNYNILKCDFETFSNIIDFKGLYFNEGKLLALLDLSNLEIGVSLLNKKSKCWFALIDEIVNKQNICNISIDLNVTEFFLNNNEFIFFRDENKEHIEIPTSVYTGTYEKQLYFLYTFGNSSSNNNSIFGSGYYFTNFENAIRQGGWSANYQEENKYGEKLTDSNSGKYIKGGIIRYALFLGDNLIKDSTSHVEYDDKWKDDFDSVYLAKLKLDSSETINITSHLYVVKDYYNHIPLSYHYIDKRLLNDRFDESINYQII